MHRSSSRITSSHTSPFVIDSQNTGNGNQHDNSNRRKIIIENSPINNADQSSPIPTPNSRSSAVRLAPIQGASLSRLSSPHQGLLSPNNSYRRAASRGPTSDGNENSSRSVLNNNINDDSNNGKDKINPRHLDIEDDDDVMKDGEDSLRHRVIPHHTPVASGGTAHFHHPLSLSPHHSVSPASGGGRHIPSFSPRSYDNSHTISLNSREDNNNNNNGNGNKLHSECDDKLQNMKPGNIADDARRKRRSFSMDESRLVQRNNLERVES